MLENLRKRLERDEEGFTLIELMVVVLIIAILLAIAIPTFLGARDRANDRAAQSSLRNALTAAKTIYTDEQKFDNASEDATKGLKTIEPSLEYVATDKASSDFKKVSVGGKDGLWGGAVLSKSDKCFLIREDVSTGTTYGWTAKANCTADFAKSKALASDFNTEYKA